VVRANNIFNKMKERHGLTAADVISSIATLPTTVLTANDEEAHELWGLVFEAARLDEIVEQAVRTLELSVVAKYAFGLAQAFNGFYHRSAQFSTKSAGGPCVACSRRGVLQRSARALDLLGCGVPCQRS
jgi:arginyl-tRNA synthetase